MGARIDTHSVEMALKDVSAVVDKTEGVPTMHFAFS